MHLKRVMVRGTMLGLLVLDRVNIVVIGGCHFTASIIVERVMICIIIGVHLVDRS